MADDTYDGSLSPPIFSIFSRRHPDLRLWIESRKSEGGKRLGSPSRSRLVAKRVARSSERATVSKRSHLGAGDPRRRLAGYRARKRALPMKRNKILKSESCVLDNHTRNLDSANKDTHTHYCSMMSE